MPNHGARPEDWLALILTPGLGPRRFAELAASLGPDQPWFSASDRALLKAGLGEEQLHQLRKPDPEALARCLAWLESPSHHLITLDDPLYPPLLRQISAPPAALFVVGDPMPLVQPQIAIVGSRNATRSGLEHARDFARTLAQRGFVVTSGLALGIDGQAHEACLEAGGTTIAVMGTGPDRIYPARHRQLAHRIVPQGALITQFPPGTEARPGHFPARNRLISGMALGTLVVEAGLRSGSLITAREAAEQGREVFAIPGSVHNPLARGCHQLIREGARLVETADELIEAIAPLAGELAGTLRGLLALPEASSLDMPAPPPHISLDPDYQHLLEIIGHDPLPIDQIIQGSELTAAEVSSMLLMLELEGWIEAHPGGRYSRSR